MGATKPRPSLLAVLLLLCAALAAASGAREGGDGRKILRVTGVVRLVGSGPGMELLLSGEDREWHIDRKDRDRLWNLQHQTVTVEGEERVEDLVFADGRPAGERRSLRNITLVSVNYRERADN